MKVQDHRQIQPPFAGPDVAYVASPFLVRLICFEVAIQQVRGDVERMIAVCGRLELACSFNADPVFAHQAAHAPMANIDANFLEFQQYADPAVAKPTSLVGNLLHLLADLGTVQRAFTPDCLWIDTNQPIRPALRDVMIPHHPERRVSPLRQCRQLFPSRSFKTTLSSMVSANRRLSLASSSSRAFNLAASDTFYAAILGLQLVECGGAQAMPAAHFGRRHPAS